MASDAELSSAVPECSALEPSSSADTSREAGAPEPTVAGMARVNTDDMVALQEALLGALREEFREDRERLREEVARGQAEILEEVRALRRDLFDHYETYDTSSGEDSFTSRWSGQFENITEQVVKRFEDLVSAGTTLLDAGGNEAAGGSAIVKATPASSRGPQGSAGGGTGISKSIVKGGSSEVRSRPEPEAAGPLMAQRRRKVSFQRVEVHNAAGTQPASPALPGEPQVAAAGKSIDDESHAEVQDIPGSSSEAAAATSQVSPDPARGALLDVAAERVISGAGSSGSTRRSSVRDRQGDQDRNPESGHGASKGAPDSSVTAGSPSVQIPEQAAIFLSGQGDYGTGPSAGTAGSAKEQHEAIF